VINLGTGRSIWSWRSLRSDGVQRRIDPVRLYAADPIPRDEVHGAQGAAYLDTGVIDQRDRTFYCGLGPATLHDIGVDKRRAE